MQELGTRAARSKLFIGLAHVAAARCGKGDDCFTLQIIAFQKCIDDRRSNIPPDRESDKDGVVFVHVITLGSDGRARGTLLRSVSLSPANRAAVIRKNASAAHGFCTCADAAVQ